MTYGDLKNGTVYKFGDEIEWVFIRDKYEFAFIDALTSDMTPYFDAGCSHLDVCAWIPQELLG